MQNILFSINTVAPVFIIIIVGIVLKRLKYINDNFIDISSKIVFTVALPALVFIKIAQSDFTKLADPKELLFGCIGIFICFVFSFAIGMIFVKKDNQKGVFIQGAFRGNYAIIGLALLYNMYQDIGLSKAAIILAITLPVFNILSIIALIVSTHKMNADSYKKILIKIITNPNIIAVVIGIIFSVFNIPIHNILVKSIDDIAAITIPLALIGIGGTLSLHNLKANFILSLVSSLLKILVTPIIFTIISCILGFRDLSLSALFLLFAVPTAVTSFVFAKEMDGDADLASNIVLFTTVGSIFTIAVGVYVLKALGLI